MKPFFKDVFEVVNIFIKVLKICSMWLKIRWLPQKTTPYLCAVWMINLKKNIKNVIYTGIQSSHIREKHANL